MATHPIDSGVSALLVGAALERYESSWDQLLESWCDRALCRAADAELDHIRKLIASLPQLSSQLTELVMRHAQLLRALVRPASPQERRAQVAALKRKHADAVAALRALSRCAALAPVRPAAG
ncbi:hypothetical protein [Caenimonas aquaedulcis]|uniref:Uncharacterized protein n=1 Tax=Caenimonas aquaedulcis TaxID=2793270 RepID=A0A931H4E3_9BURK|nr:hypothetical protein [Caenimonas aquaedulcis]MBG9388419.1 hypothetical protein [Caenimonas aquaedulcis]